MAASPHRPHRDWVPRGYVAEALIGAGASSQVWRARVSATGEQVALKRLRLADPETAARARAEAELLAALDHDGIVRLHSAVPVGGWLVLVLDLAQAGSLREVIVARGRLAAGEVAAALAPIAAALAHLHSRSVVHGDVSAANILFTEDARPLLADVGVARLLGDRWAAESTPCYLDPLVATGAAPVPASDVFMLAAVAFHALTGQSLWGEAAGGPDGVRAMLARACGGVPDTVPQTLTRAGVPVGLQAVLARALRDEPALRCSAVEFALELRHAVPLVAPGLTAGRERPAPVPPASPGSDPPPAAAPPAAAPVAGRPEFLRPGPAAADAGEPSTWALAPRPRPVLPPPRPPRGWRGRLRTPRTATPAASRSTAPSPAPPPGGRHRRPVGVPAAVVGPAVLDEESELPVASPRPAVSRSSGRWRRPAPAVLVALGLLVTLAAVGAARLGDASHAPNAPKASNTANAPDGVHPPGGTATGGDPRERWRVELAAIDARRARAYALGDPALLSTVYSVDALLQADVRRLRATVPAGCSLSGAVTAYRVLTVRTAGAAPEQVELTAVASLPASRLTCAGRSRLLPAVPPTRLRIELTDTAAGRRICAQRLA